MVLQKPECWEKMVFIEKLRWYAKKDNELKNLYSDKYKIKFLLQKMGLKGLHYSKICTHVKPVNKEVDLDIIVPIEMELKPPEYQFTKKKMNEIINQVKNPDEFWEVLKDDYDIHPNNAENNPPKSYVYKINLGWNSMIFVINNKLTKIVYGTKTYEPTIDNMLKWKKNILSNYTKKIPSRFFVEEFIGYNLKVFEIYCIYGKPKLLSIYFETNASYENNFLIHLPEDNEKGEFKLELLKNKYLFEGSKDIHYRIKDDVVKQMCDYSKEFANYFEFIRMDFYYTNNKIYFSECTFKPGALKKIKWGDIGKSLSSFWTRKPPV
jgi:hypothetical protein